LQHPQVLWWKLPILPNADRIAAAAVAVSHMGFDGLLEAAFRAASAAGPWNPSAADLVTESYRHVELRRPIAEAIEARFGAQLRAPIDLEQQECWLGDAAGSRGRMGAAFRDFGFVYGSGEFPWHAVRTITSPPEHVHQDVVGELEIPAPVGRWAMPIDRSTIAERPVYTVHGPTDWARLIAKYPKPAEPRQGCWGLPDNQSELLPEHPLFSVEHQRAAVREHAGHLVPDWTSIAEEFSGVHLSWGGWITSEGYAHLDEQNQVTMLRYWFSDHTFWLRDVFGDPVPFPAPNIEQVSPATQQDEERALLKELLGR